MKTLISFLSVLASARWLKGSAPRPWHCCFLDDSNILRAIDRGDSKLTYQVRAKVSGGLILSDFELFASLFAGDCAIFFETREYMLKGAPYLFNHLRKFGLVDRAPRPQRQRPRTTRRARGPTRTATRRHSRCLDQAVRTLALWA